VLVILDVFSKWVEAYPTTDNTAATVVKVLMKEIVPRFGIPRTLSSDNGPHFIGQINKEFCLQLGIKQQLHCAYRPQAAGMVERTNQTLKTKLAKLQTETGSSWVKMLPLVLYQMRAVPAGRTGLSPAEIIYGRPFRTPWDQLSPPPVEFHHMTTEVEGYVMALTQTLKEIHSRVRAAVPALPAQAGPGITPGSWVLVKNWTRKSLEPRWEGPYIVLLSTPTAVKIGEKSAWIYNHHCKIIKEKNKK